MTDPHDLDELASAHLDGATTAEERARIDADPQLQARVEALRQVRAAVQQPVPVSGEAREAAVAAALAAYDEQHRDQHGGRAVVTPLPTRRGPSPTAIRALGAAAVVALLALVVPLLAERMGDDDQGTSFDATGNAIEGAEGGVAEDSGSSGRADGGGTAAPSTTAVPTTDLGSFPDVGQLAAAVRARVEADDAPGEFSESLEPQAGGCVADEPSYLATVDGDRVIVVTYVEPSTQEAVLEVYTGDGTCQLLLAAPLR